MAYVSHSPYRAYVRNSGSARVDLSLIGRAALAALVAGAAIVALSGAALEGGTQVHALAKGDRIASASSVSTPYSNGYVVDRATMTTTVQKGAATELSADSPYSAVIK